MAKSWEGLRHWDAWDLERGWAVQCGCLCPSGSERVSPESPAKAGPPSSWGPGGWLGAPSLPHCTWLGVHTGQGSSQVSLSGSLLVSAVLTCPTAFHHTSRAYIVRGLGLALLKKILRKPEDTVGAMFHNIPSPPPSSPGSCWQGEERSDSRVDQDSAPGWAVQELRVMPPLLQPRAGQVRCRPQAQTAL